MEATKLVVAYCRISTLEQKKSGLGIEIQVRDTTLFARERGLFIDHFYRDEGQSGMLESRPQLKELIRECKLRRIQILIIPSLDRLSRNVRLAENLFWQFERYGVRVLIADMPSYDNSDRREVLIRQIREAIAEDNRKDIIERLLKGRQERVRKGRVPGGTAPYGYRREHRTFVPDASEAAIVRQIFDKRMAGTSVSNTCELLNQQELRRRNGKPWTQRQVRLILSRAHLYEFGRFHYGRAEGANDNLILVRKAA
ncbi:MAG: recombinase family protein [Candidatus Korobacteraceae bacterium]